MTSDQIRAKRKKLDARNERLKEAQAILSAEYDFLRQVCKHPGLKLGTDIGGGPDGRCEICGKCW